MVPRKSFVYWAISAVFAILLFAVPQDITVVTGIICADFLIVLAIFNTIHDAQDNIPFILFNVTYFLFVLSGVTFSLIEGDSVKNYIGMAVLDSEVTSASRIAFMGIMLVNCFYFLFYKNSITSEQINPIQPKRPVLQFINSFFVLTYFCKFAMAAEKMLASDAMGYIYLYTRTGSSLPSIITYIGALFYFTLMMVLAINPPKKRSYLIIISVLIIEAMILNSGDRGEPVCVLLVLLVYIVQRCKIEPDFLIHKRRAIVVGVVSIPIGMYVLQAIKYLRRGNAFSLSFIEGVIEFFKSQGVSFNIVVYACALGDRIKSIFSGSYVLGQLIGYLTQNVFVRTLFRIPLIRGNSVEMANSGYSFGSTLSYILSPTSYVNGIGAGTCYLAELYTDASWLGIVAGSIVIALILRKLKDMNEMSWLKHALYLNALRCILYIPRGEFFRWLTETFSIPNLMLLFVVLMIDSFAKGRER